MFYTSDKDNSNNNNDTSNNTNDFVFYNLTFHKINFLPENTQVFLREAITEEEVTLADAPH